MRHGKLVCICPVKALDSSLHRASRSDSLQAALASVKIPDCRIAALPGGGCVVGSDAGLVSSGHVVVAFSGQVALHFDSYYFVRLCCGFSVMVLPTTVQCFEEFAWVLVISWIVEG
jgi:hypothetical protein